MKELKKILLEKFSDQIEKIILFGSRVENKENEFSDYDILSFYENLMIGN
jgi:predicted nucleotidyltransferase